MEYFKFSSPSRICASINYSGPSASLRIFYSNFFAESDYLVSVPYIANSPDCYMFDKNCEYIIELSPYGIMGSTSFSFQMSILTMSNFSNHDKYIFHQTFDSSSNVGYHYQTEYYNLSTSDYTATNSYVNSYSNSTSFDDKIDSNHWFYNPNQYSFSDNRRVVVDTGYSEFSSIAFSEATQVFNKSDGTFTNSAYNRFSGTFVSETTVVSCAHSIFACQYNSDGGILCTGLNKDIYFCPGINDYSSMSIDYYGKYRAYELYAPISYLLRFYNNGGIYSLNCSNYDWSICLTTNIYSGSRTHSYMGLSGFSLLSNDSTFSYARCAGYPLLNSNPTDNYLYEKTMWVSYPLESTIYLYNGILISSDIAISGGNSGGPLYYKYTSVQNGQPTTYLYLFGVVSGKVATNSSCISAFYRNSALFTNIVNAVTN